MDRMIEQGFPTGVVTFSDKLVICIFPMILAKLFENVSDITLSDLQVAERQGAAYGGEDLVRPMVFHALRRHWMKLDRSLALPDAIKKARMYVETVMAVHTKSHPTIKIFA